MTPITSADVVVLWALAFLASWSGAVVALAVYGTVVVFAGSRNAR